MDLPRFIHLSSIDTNKYVRYRKEEDSNHAFLEFSQDEKAEIQYIKFEVQKSEVVDGFVHIRSCYNNKYWVRKSGDTNLIAAEANEPEEDQSKWSCTLFKPVLIDPPEGDDADADDVDVLHSCPPKPQKIRLLHIDQVGKNYACLSSKTPGDVDLLVLGDDQVLESRTTSSDAFLAYNAGAHVILPRFVAFMAHNNQYGAITRTAVNRPTYLEFKTTNLNLAGVSHRIHQNFLPHQPFVEVQNTSFSGNRGYWMGGEGSFTSYVVLEDIFMIKPTPAFFTPMSLGGNLIALMHGTSSYAVCGSGNGMSHVLQLSGARSISNVMAVFRIVETALMREINNVRYNHADSRVYNITSEVKSRLSLANSTDVEQTMTVNVSYTITNTMSWNDAITIPRTLANSMFCGIPRVGNDGAVVVTPESPRTARWGEELREDQHVNYEQAVTIPPRKRLALTVVATKSQFDVPFTYAVRETLTDGTVGQDSKNDGLFKGSNDYNFVTSITEENL